MSEVNFLYRNWRGETSWRRVQPLRLHFGVSEWHPQPQWLMDAIDLDKGQERSFALADVLEVEGDVDLRLR